MGYTPVNHAPLSLRCKNCGHTETLDNVRKQLVIYHDHSKSFPCPKCHVEFFQGKPNIIDIKPINKIVKIVGVLSNG